MGNCCDAWYLLKNGAINIIQERMPPGTAETLHKPNKARQFFFVLSGSATVEHGGTTTSLAAGSGLELAPGVPHRILNRSSGAIDFLVTSQPPSHIDRVEVAPNLK